MIDTQTISSFKNLIETFSLEKLEEEREKLMAKLNQMVYDPNLGIELSLIQELIAKRKESDGETK